MQSSPRKEKSKRRKQNWKTKSKDVHFSTEYIFLKPKDQTNEQKNKWTIKIKMYIYTANVDLYLFFICF